MSNGEAGAPDLDPTAAVETPREQGEAPDEFAARRAVLALSLIHISEPTRPY